MNATAPAVKLLGDPVLRKVCAPVGDPGLASFRAENEALRATLADFRTTHGFGRAVSAPQIGIGKRFIALELGSGPWTMIDPEITWTSSESFTLWDDCMSFPVAPGARTPAGIDLGALHSMSPGADRVR